MKKRCANCPLPQPGDGVRETKWHVCLNAMCECDRPDMHFELLPNDSRNTMSWTVPPDPSDSGQLP